MRTISKLIIAFGAVASGALPVHATAFTATFECGEQTVAIVNYKGNLEISISMPANFDAGTVNKSVRWDTGQAGRPNPRRPGLPPDDRRGNREKSP